MTEHEVKQMARLMAIEIITTATAVRLHRLMRSAGASFDLNADREALKASYRAMSIPGVKAEWSDLISAELAEALDELMLDIARRVDQPD